MGITCKSVVFEKPGKVGMTTVELPEPGTGDIVVRTLFSGISPGTELWSLTGKYWSTKFPALPGYQKVGTVERVGADVTNYAVGDTVFTRSTRVPADVNIEWAGHTGMSVVSADDAETFKLPDGLALEQASLLIMPAVGYHGAAEVMPIEEGESVAVIGLGLIGQFSAQTCAMRGGRVIALDLVEKRRHFAAELAGATVIDPANEDAAATIREIAPDGLDAVIDCSANADAVNASFLWLRNQGRYCFQGYYPGRTPIEMLWVNGKELVTYHPTNVTPEGTRACAKYLAEGTMRLGPMITHVIPVDDAPAAYEMLLNCREEALGVVLDWQTD